MADLSRDDVLKLAKLVRLDLSSGEVDQYQQEITSILQYVDQLQNVDLGGLNPTTQVTGLANVMRDDELIDYGAAPDDLLRLAPSVQDDQIKVKRMIQ